VGKGGFLAMTHGVVKDIKSQGFGKGMFSGEGFFINRISGVGILFVTSLGAIVQRNLKQGEQWIVDNGHLVAWNCPYTIERSGGGLMSGMHAGEGLVCRFTGPGTIFIQVNLFFVVVPRGFNPISDPMGCDTEPIGIFPKSDDPTKIR